DLLFISGREWIECAYLPSVTCSHVVLALLIALRAQPLRQRRLPSLTALAIYRRRSPSSIVRAHQCKAFSYAQHGGQGPIPAGRSRRAPPPAPGGPLHFFSPS